MRNGMLYGKSFHSLPMPNEIFRWKSFSLSSHTKRHPPRKDWSLSVHVEWHPPRSESSLSLIPNGARVIPRIHFPSQTLGMLPSSIFSMLPFTRGLRGLHDYQRPWRRVLVLHIKVRGKMLKTCASPNQECQRHVHFQAPPYWPLTCLSPIQWSISSNHDAKQKAWAKVSRKAWPLATKPFIYVRKCLWVCK